jgi:hypothetical protein
MWYGGAFALQHNSPTTDAMHIANKYRAKNLLSDLVGAAMLLSLATDNARDDATGIL